VAGRGRNQRTEKPRLYVKGTRGTPNLIPQKAGNQVWRLPRMGIDQSAEGKEEGKMHKWLGRTMAVVALALLAGRGAGGFCLMTSGRNWTR